LQDKATSFWCKQKSCVYLRVVAMGPKLCKKQNKKNLHKFSIMDYSDFLKKKEFEEIRTLQENLKVSITDIQNEVENKSKNY
jgi:hypothetical protein